VINNRSGISFPGDVNVIRRLVVLGNNVELRFELFYETAFQKQGFGFGSYGYVINICDVFYQEAGFWAESDRWLEV
jgi:hypothetical protein